MNATHDLGGLLGFGPIPSFGDERSFEAAWEARVFAILRCLLYAGLFTVDELRYAVERLPPDTYHRASYFERWAYAIEALAVQKGALAEDQRREIAAIGTPEDA